MICRFTFWNETLMPHVSWFGRRGRMLSYCLAGMVRMLRRLFISWMLSLGAYGSVRCAGGRTLIIKECEYTEVNEPEKLVWLHSVSDADWNIIANPMMENWPRVLLTVVTFEEAESKTRVTLTWQPHEATDEEIACFRNAMDGMGKGWNAGMELLEELLTELQG